MKALLLTLGHNSSAIFYDGASKPIGYEQERLTGIKSDSSFPKEAILEIQKHVSLKRCTIMVSHWFDSFDLEQARDKYYDHGFMKKLVKDFDCSIIGLTRHFTHHDAHAYSSKAFYDDHEDEDDHRNNKYYIVADGFGNQQEVLSIYKDHSGGLLKILSSRGYNSSLGLMYQYATSFCGMKENQDEYKFLGYETSISEVLTNAELTKELMPLISSLSLQMFNDLLESDREEIKLDDPYIDLHALGECKTKWYRTFENTFIYLDKEEYLDRSSHMKILVGFMVQNIAEQVIELLINHFEMDNVCLSGGCFYNVKLNNKVLKSIPGKLSVMPLAGDQGAAIGMYAKYIGKFKFYDLCYGIRPKLMYDNEAIESTQYKPVYIHENIDQFVQAVCIMLLEGKIVNIVKGNMEFGPRALCNTTTLALPTKENVEYINTVNERNTVMPMAPVMTRKAASGIFDDMRDLDRVVGSNKFMIITHDVDPRVKHDESIKGIMHKYPLEDRYSARPQIIDNSEDLDPVMHSILTKINRSVLINTSFNTHGTPILFTFEQVIADFKKQMKLDTKNRITLAILKQ